MRVRVRQFLRIFVLTDVFVGARLSTTDIADALEGEYGVGEYVDPEGPLNIMRGHPCVSNGMIAKQRKYAAPMRLAYSRTGNGSRGDCAYTRNAHEDEVRELPGDSEAVVYLSAHYRILKSMFTVDNDVVVINRSPGAPFCNLRGRERVELFAALLVLAGGGDIRPSTGGNCIDEGERAISLVVYDADTSAPVLYMESADRATLAVMEFFVEYGGNNASRVAGYGLHYTDSPSFLIQAYICEFFEESEDVIRIFKAAKEIIARLPAGDASVQPGPRFFTTDTEYVRSYGEMAGYSGLAEAEMAFSGVQPALLEDWLKLDYGNTTDPKHIASALLKLCCCLSMNPAVDLWNDRFLHNPENELQRSFRDCVKLAHQATSTFNRTGDFPASFQNSLGICYDYFLELARGSESATVADCSSANISTVVATDPRDFLVVLAWVLGESEDKLQSLRQLLEEALSDTGKFSSCKEVGKRVGEIFSRLLSLEVWPAFDVCTAPNGARYGSLWLNLWPGYDDVQCNYALKLVFKPEKVEVVYVCQEINLTGERRSRLFSALRKRDIPCDPVRRFAHAAPEEPYRPSLCSLIQESIERCLNPATHRLRADAHIAEAYAARDPLACHIAVSRWMAYTPIQSLGEAVKAGDEQLPALEDLLARSTGRNNPTRRALTADSPVVAMLDNILGSAAITDDTLRPFIADGLRRCVGGRTDLFPSIFSLTDASSKVEVRSEFAYNCFCAYYNRYDMLEMLVRHAELRARGKIQAAGNVQGPWSSEVCLAVARGFRLRYENSIRSYSGKTPDVRHYERYFPAFIDAARRAQAAQAAAIGAAAAKAKTARAAVVQAEAAQVKAARAAAAEAVGNAEFLKKSNFCVDAVNLCGAAAECFQRRHRNSPLSLSSDTLDTCYYRCSVATLIAVAADPDRHNTYCGILRDIWVCWDDTLRVIEVYAHLQKTFRKLPSPGPLSPRLIRKVFLNLPTVEQIKSLLRIFAIFARTDRDYCGLCSVFNDYRCLLSPEFAREFVELLKERDEVYRKTHCAITFHKKIWCDEGRALPYSAFMDLLVECVGDDTISEQRLLERVQDLLGVKAQPRKESFCTIC
ncbi:hypothetical protein PAPHI01_1595 [Pancytospora philotis]|nr:hypothetical protein PAPHI01_1595 [Pancytospora philotis]